MPTDKIFTGNVAPVADVWTYAVATTTSGTVHGVGRNGKTVSVVAGSGETTLTLAAKLQAALAAAGSGEFQEYAWPPTTTAIVTGTAKRAGIPATFTNASTGGTAGTLTNATPAVGPNFLSAAGNWSGGSLPATGDRFVFDGNSPDVLYGLDWPRTAGVVPAKVLVIDFGGSIGLPPVVGTSLSASIGPGAGASYPEDRLRFLQLPSGTIEATVGVGDDVPTRVNLDLAGTGTTLNVFGAKAPAAGEAASVYVQGTTGHPRLAVSQGAVAVAHDTGTTGGFAAVLVGDEGSPASDATVLFGRGATVPSLTNQSGTTEAAAAVTALVMGPAANAHRQSAGDCSATMDGGTLTFSSPGTLTVTARNDGTAVDFSRSPVPKTLASTSSFTGGAKFLDPASTRTSGSGATFDHLSLPKSKLGVGVAVVKA